MRKAAADSRQRPLQHTSEPLRIWCSSTIQHVVQPHNQRKLHPARPHLAAEWMLLSMPADKQCQRMQQKSLQAEEAEGCGGLVNKRIEERAAAAATSLRPQRIQ